MKNLTVDVKIKKENEKEIENGLESIKIDNQNFYKIEHKDSLNVADITTLKNITIVDLLNNIKNRFTQKIITSSIGNELIIVNPFEFYQDHMCAEKMDYYIDVKKKIKILFSINLKGIKIKNYYGLRKKAKVRSAHIRVHNESNLPVS